MAKYAAIVITTGGSCPHRVLIKYTKYEDDGTTRNYSGTKVIYKDKYFTEPGHSHQYVFDDDGYSAVRVDSSHYTPEFSSKKEVKKFIKAIKNKRVYHAYMHVLSLLPHEFVCKTDKQAIKMYYDTWCNDNPKLEKI